MKLFDVYENKRMSMRTQHQLDPTEPDVSGERGKSKDSENKR